MTKPLDVKALMRDIGKKPLVLRDVVKSLMVDTSPRTVVYQIVDTEEALAFALQREDLPATHRLIMCFTFEWTEQGKLVGQLEVIKDQQVMMETSKTLFTSTMWKKSFECDGQYVDPYLEGIISYIRWFFLVYAYELRTLLPLSYRQGDDEDVFRPMKPTFY